MLYTEKDVLYTVYAFYGGKLHGKEFYREYVESICEGHTPDRSKERAMGCLCQRKELDNQPTVEGYYGPLYDGIRYVMLDGSIKHDFQVIDASEIDYSFIVLRYESEEVYRHLSI